MEPPCDLTFDKVAGLLKYLPPKERAGLEKHLRHQAVKDSLGKEYIARIFPDEDEKAKNL